jgi:hypothetical protein
MRRPSFSQSPVVQPAVQTGEAMRHFVELTWKTGHVPARASGIAPLAMNLLGS